MPAPTGDVVLTVNRGKGDDVVFDLATLESIGLVEGELFEPFFEERQTFRGVELSAVLSAAGVPSSADVHLVALDDYAIDLSASDIEQGGILVATSVDGERIAISNGGPIRVVFLDEAKLGQDTDLWIWSLASIYLEI